MEKFKKYILSVVLLLVFSCFCLSGCSKKQENTNYDDYVFELSSDETFYKIVLYKGYDETLVIPSEYNGKPIQEIEKYAFQGSDFVSVTIPNSIKKIGRLAFANCYRLRYITLGNGIEEMDMPFISSYPDLLNATISNKYAFESFSDGGWILRAYTLKVPKSIADNATNDFLNDTTNYTKTIDGDYYIYTRVKDIT